MDSAVEGDEIWVKQGTYNIAKTILVFKVVFLYGGFDGTETQVEPRDWVNNITEIT